MGLGSIYGKVFASWRNLPFWLKYMFKTVSGNIFCPMLTVKQSLLDGEDASGMGNGHRLRLHHQVPLAPQTFRK